jgi:hypothetical protein
MSSPIVWIRHIDAGECRNSFPRTVCVLTDIVTGLVLSFDDAILVSASKDNSIKFRAPWASTYGQRLPVPRPRSSGPSPLRPAHSTSLLLPHVRPALIVLSGWLECME